jgi:ABC-2 type transport system permease protein
VRHVLRVLRHAAITGYQDYKTIYTWRTWLAGWYLRVVSQVIFFALIGELLGSRARTHEILIGAAVLLATVTSFIAVASTAWERWAGTLPLLVASPSSPVIVFAGRSVTFIADGVLTSLGSFFAAAVIFGLPLPWPHVLLIVPLTLLVALSSYMLAIFLGGLVLRAMSTRNVVSNLATGTIMAIGGVAVPVTYYPEPVQWFANLLPLTHGLQSIRDVLNRAPAADILANVALEALVGLGWLGLALLTFNRLAEGGRRDGSIEFA